METKPLSYKIIFHIDMNCFFASCERIEDPTLIGKPIVVAHNDVFRKSIILTASYEARKFGIYTTMLVKDAMRLCPSLTIVEPKFHLYQKQSKIFFDYLYTLTPKIEITSIDEGYLDVTEVVSGADALFLAQKIQDELRDTYHLPCSIGIAPNKFLAKMASDMKKPLGITVLRKREIQEKLWPLPIKAMIGVGKKTEPRLQAIGIQTIGDLVNFQDQTLLQKTVGTAMYEYLLERANGQDNSEVNYQTDDEVSSISNAHTFYVNVNSPKVIKETLKVLSNSVSNRLMSRGLYASNVGIQLRFGDFQQINRSRGLVDGINDSSELWNIIEDIFDDYYDGYSEVRLVGVFATRFVTRKEKTKQVTIFDDFDKITKEQQLSKILGAIKDQYGQTSIKVGYYKYEKKEEEV